MLFSPPSIVLHLIRSPWKSLISHGGVINKAGQDEILKASSYERFNNAIYYHFHVLLIQKEFIILPIKPPAWRLCDE